ncbi:O-antigen ligase family protein [Pectinatus frisingensis]|uniref:O-antigen ligase family protein n=1 Tax=Pectinatus frisingensis TaxID=865 RepID=UPI0018C7D120|nr:O-antigen ligase family protein [Pectinatus frisingensis]
MPTISKEIFAEKLDKLMYFFLLIFSLTFYIDIPINFIVIVFALGLIKYILIRPKIKLETHHIFFVGFFLLGILVSLLFSSGGQPLAIALNAYKSLYIAPLAGLFLVFFFHVNRHRIIVLLSCVAFSLSINAIIAVLQFFYGIKIDRVIGLFSNVMLLSATHLLILPILLVIVVYAKNVPRFLKYFYSAVILINIPFVMLAGTRIVWIGLSICSVLIFVWGIKNKLKLVPIGLGILLIIFITVYFNPALKARFDSIDNISTNVNTGYQSNRERILMWRAAWQMFEDYPVFGVGLDNFYKQYKDNYKVPTAREVQWHAHNTVLNTMAQSGIVGTIGLLSLFVYLYHDVIRAWKRDKNVITVAYFFSLLGYTINLMTDVLFSGHSVKLPTYIFWLITGIYLSLNHYIKISNK